MSNSNSPTRPRAPRGRSALAFAALTAAAWGCTTNVNLGDVGSTIASGGVGGRAGAALPAARAPRDGAATSLSPADVPGLAPKAPAETVVAPGQAPAQGAAPAKDGPAPVVAPEPPQVVQAIPNSPWKDVPVGTKPFLPASPLSAPVAWPRSQVVVSAEVANSPQLKEGGEGFVVGRLVDKQGQVAVGVPVLTELEQTTTNEEGWYRLRIKAGADARIRIGGNEAGYVPQDWNLSVFPDDQLVFHNEVLRLDQVRTRINVAKGGVARSSRLDQVLGVDPAAMAASSDPRRAFGLFQAQDPIYAVYMEVPPGALEFPDNKTETDVVLTWLDPLPRDGKPYGDLYGPLQSYTVWNSANQAGVLTDKVEPFNPVNFADLDLGGARIKPGGEVKVKWVVGKEVEKRFPITLQNGQAFFPCYQYDGGWVKPVLATVFFEKGYYWATYTMRGSNSPTVTP